MEVIAVFFCQTFFQIGTSQWQMTLVLQLMVTINQREAETAAANFATYVNGIIIGFGCRH